LKEKISNIRKLYFQTPCKHPEDLFTLESRQPTRESAYKSSEKSYTKANRKSKKKKKNIQKKALGFPGKQNFCFMRNFDIMNVYPEIVKESVNSTHQVILKIVIIKNSNNSVVLFDH